MSWLQKGITVPIDLLQLSAEVATPRPILGSVSRAVHFRNPIRATKTSLATVATEDDYDDRDQNKHLSWRIAGSLHVIETWFQKPSQLQKVRD